MNPFYLINIFCAWLSWRFAQDCRPNSGAWWFNMFASALNAVLVIRELMRIYYA